MVIRRVHFSPSKQSVDRLATTLKHREEVLAYVADSADALQASRELIAATDALLGRSRLYRNDHQPPLQSD